jgi:hypothetical protein
MQFKSQWFGEALAAPAYPLDSREETIFEALVACGAARSVQMQMQPPRT